MFETDLFVERFKKIEKVIAESELLKIGKKAFLEEIQSDELGQAEKEEAAAHFITQMMTNALNISCEMALRVGISYEEEKAKKESTYHQSELTKEQINKLALEKDLIKAQISLTNQQESIEFAKLESAKLDLEVKLKQIEAMKAQVLSEIEKVKTLNKTADDNLRIKVAELLVQFMQIATGKDWVKLEGEQGASLYTHILTHIESILDKSKQIGLDNNKLNKIIDEALNNKNIQIPQIEKSTQNYNVLVSNFTPKVDEVVSIFALSSDANINPKIFIDKKLIYTGYATSLTFKEKRAYELKVEFRAGLSRNYEIRVC